MLLAQYKGIVVKGEGIAGIEYSTPTANLDLGKIALEHGIYAARTVYDGDTYNSAVCYGADGKYKFEVHLLNFDKDIYGEELEVTVIEKISEVIPWVSKERMRQKILDDLHQIREYFKKRAV